MRSENRKYLPRLDMLRALAAWWVVLHHCFTMIPNSMLVEATWLEDLNPLPVVITAPWIPLTLFMVVSGYSIGRGLSGHTIRWRGYLGARILRVGPLYWVLLLLGTITGARTMAEFLGQQETPRTVVESVLMLPTPSAYTPFPWLATAWSVPIEVTLYLLVPAMVWALRKWSRMKAVVIILGACSAVIAGGFLLGWGARDVLYANVPGRLFEFACGLLLAYIGPRGVARTAARRCAVAAVVLLIAMAYVSHTAGGVHATGGLLRGGLFLAGVLVAGLLILWAEAEHVHGTHWSSRMLVRLGQWSYSTYLWHFTVLALVAIPVSARLTLDLGLSMWTHLLIGTVITALLTAPLSYLSFRYIETPFLRLRPHYVVESTPTLTAHSQR